MPGTYGAIFSRCSAASWSLGRFAAMRPAAGDAGDWLFLSGLSAPGTSRPD